MNTNNQPVPSSQDIKDAAIELMKQNGTTTNLDIKNLLRSKNFWVSQDEVSKAMSTIASEENFDRSWNGSYNTWSIPVVQDTTTSNTSNDSSTSNASNDASTGNNTIITATTNAAPGKGLADVVDNIARKLGIYKQAINQNSNLQKDLGFIDRDYTTIGSVYGADIKECKTVQDIVNLINK